MQEIILAAKTLHKSYFPAGNELHILKDISFELRQGESVAIVGPSGSGKSTLLGISAGLDSVSSGELHLCGKNLADFNEDQRAELRSREVGFIFQAFQLLPTLTALENVMVPLELQGQGGEKEAQQRARQLLQEVGLAERMDHYPSQLSGGEQQRVAIARAFINKPRILFADEPTGNLDSETGAAVEQMLFDLNEKHNTTLVLVTHDIELAAKTQRVLRMKAGHLSEDLG